MQGGGRKSGAVELAGEENQRGAKSLTGCWSYLLLKGTFSHCAMGIHHEPTTLSFLSAGLAPAMCAMCAG